MSKKIYGPNGLPLYKIRVHGQIPYAVEVEGLPVPNPYGKELFVHRCTEEGSLYGVSEVSTGFLAGRVHTDTPFETIANVFSQKDFEKRLVDKVENALAICDPLETLPVITLKELAQKRREAFIAACREYDEAEDEE